jgi:hypothetical protein
MGEQQAAVVQPGRDHQEQHQAMPVQHLVLEGPANEASFLPSSPFPATCGSPGSYFMLPPGTQATYVQITPTQAVTVAPCIPSKKAPCSLQVHKNRRKANGDNGNNICFLLRVPCR